MLANAAPLAAACDLVDVLHTSCAPGDWWDKRGDLPVEPLNAVIHELGSWEVPVIMLPGNHDQVTAGGEDRKVGKLLMSKGGH
jgi:hypothetical protein